jgi:hypothetical protein
MAWNGVLYAWKPETVKEKAWDYRYKEIRTMRIRVSDLYLASQNQNHARLIVPPGKSRYERRLGVPFLLADKPVTLTATVADEKTAVVVNDEVQEMSVNRHHLPVIRLRRAE